MGILWEKVRENRRKSEKMGESQRNLGESQKMGETKGKFYKLKVDKRVREKKTILWGKVRENGRKSEKFWRKSEKFWRKLKKFGRNSLFCNPAWLTIPMNQSWLGYSKRTLTDHSNELVSSGIQ